MPPETPTPITRTGKPDPNQLRTSLGFMTNLHEHVFNHLNPGAKQPQQAQNAQNSTQNAPETASKPKAEKLPQKDNEFESKVLDELSSLKAEVESLLKEEKVEAKEETKTNDTGEKE